MTTEQLNAGIRDHLIAKCLPATDDDVEQFKADFIRRGLLNLADKNPGNYFLLAHLYNSWRQPSARRD